MTEEEKKEYKSVETCGGYLKEYTRKEASKKWWNNLSDEDKKTIFEIPNFDLRKFNKIMELRITKKEYQKIMEE